MIERDASLLPDERAELPRVIRLDQHRALGVPEQGFDLLGGERPHQAQLEKIHRKAVQLELGHPIQNGALRGAPADQGEVRTPRSVELELERLRDLARGGLQLDHALAHYRDPVIDAFGDMAFRVVLIAGGREDAARRSR